MFKYIASAVFFFVLIGTESSEADALTESDYLGDWELVHFSKVDAWAKILRIEKDRFLLCESAECIDPLVGKSIHYVGDLLVLASRSNSRNLLQLVLGGYKGKSDAKSVLFGTRYHYRDGAIISGIPTIYEKRCGEP